jgi:BMFP domain-containing protein YqiC
MFNQQWYDDMVEQAKGYLENQLQVPAEEVEQQFRVRLDAEYPTPQIGRSP